MDADKTLLRLIDEEIARLQAARSEITTQLGAGHSNGTSKRTKGDAEAIKRISLKGKTRAAQLMEFLRVNGPSATKAILAGTGMPRGSLGFTLTRVADQVQRLEDGRWSLKR
jgi:hypothetical protein